MFQKRCREQQVRQGSRRGALEGTSRRRRRGPTPTSTDYLQGETGRGTQYVNREGYWNPVLKEGVVTPFFLR